MSKPRYRWWGFVCKMIRDYPMLEKSIDDLRQQSIVADNSGMPKGGGGGRTIEAVALRQLERDDQDCYDAVAAAVEFTKLRPDGKERIRLIELVYWGKRRMTIGKAADKLFVSERTAQAWHGEFVRCAARNYGFQVK